MPNTKAQKLRVCDEQLIAALLSTSSVTDAAKACGADRVTIYNRMKDPTFNEKYEQAKRQLLDDAITALESHLMDAVDALGAVVTDPKSSAQVKINAAEAIIRNVLKLSERRDILDRLEALERLSA